MGYNYAQLFSLALTPKLTGVPSTLASLWIVLHVWNDHQKRQQVYHRLMFGCSMIWLISFNAVILSTWPIPPDSTPQVVWAMGNELTCKIQGFFIQTCSGYFFYCASLTVYFVMTIRLQMKEAEIKRYEWILHAIPLGLALSTAIVGSAFDMYDNAVLWCWIANFEDAPIYRWAFFYGPLWFCFLIVLIGMVSISITVYQTESKSSKYGKAWREGLEIERMLKTECSGQEETQAHSQGYDSDHSDSSRCSSRSHRSNLSERFNSTTQALAAAAKKKRKEYKDWLKQRRRTREVAMQALLYVTAFYFSKFFSSINRLMQQIHGSSHFAWIFCHVLFAPAQGFYYFIIYRRPLLQRLRKQHKDLSWVQLQWLSLQIKTPPPNFRPERWVTRKWFASGAGNTRVSRVSSSSGGGSGNTQVSWWSKAGKDSSSREQSHPEGSRESKRRNDTYSRQTNPLGTTDPETSHNIENNPTLDLEDNRDHDQQLVDHSTDNFAADDASQAETEGQQAPELDQNEKQEEEEKEEEEDFA